MIGFQWNSDSYVYRYHSRTSLGLRIQQYRRHIRMSLFNACGFHASRVTTQKCIGHRASNVRAPVYWKDTMRRRTVSVREVSRLVHPWYILYDRMYEPKTKIPRNNSAIHLTQSHTYLFFFDLRIPQLWMDNATIKVKCTTMTLEGLHEPLNLRA